MAAGRALGLLLGCAVLSGCAAEDRPEAVAPGAAVVERAVPEVPPVGPFRHTGRAEYRWSVAPVTADRLGASHRPGCPVAVADLRLVTVSHVDPAGRSATGELVVHASVAQDVVEVFRALHDASFPLTRVETVERYGADDGASMDADNTSAYNCRRTTGGSSWSEHAYGTAIDLNPVENPYVRGTTVLPEAGRAYLDRSDVRPGMVTPDDVVVRAFAAVGWEWGGDFASLKDYQHFSLSGR